MQKLLNLFLNPVFRYRRFLRFRTILLMQFICFEGSLFKYILEISLVAVKHHGIHHHGIWTTCVPTNIFNDIKLKK